MAYELRYHFEPGAVSRTLVTLRVEGRSSVGAGKGEATSTTDYMLVSRVTGITPEGAAVEVERPDVPGHPSSVVITPSGEMRSLRDHQRLPGSWYPLPTSPVGVGSVWKATSRPPLFKNDVVLTYQLRQVLELPGGKRAVVEWDSQALMVPTPEGARHEFHAWGSFQLDITLGKLVSARTVTRRRDVRIDAVNESITQLDLQDVTDDAVPSLP